MLLSIRDLTVPPYEASTFAKSYEIQTYLEVILATILVYDSRTPSV